MNEIDKPMPEEIQADEIIEEATKQYGELEDRIRKEPKDAGPVPQLKPPGSFDNKAYNHHAKRVAYFRNSQQEVINKAKVDAEEISKKCSPEIQKKIKDKVDAWEKADIGKLAEQLKEKNNSERASQLINNLKNKHSTEKVIEFAVNRNDINSRSDLPDFLKRDYRDSRFNPAKDKDKTQDKDDFDKDKD